MLRCTMPDEPGALARLAGAIGEAGGDILAVDVVEHTDGVALDDLVVLLPSADLRALLAGVESVEGVKVVHAGPSRGHPGDAATRLAVGLEAILDGAMTLERGIVTVVGGLLRVDEASIVPAGDAPPGGEGVLVVPIGGRALVLRREYRLTRTERDRAVALARLCSSLGPVVDSMSTTRQ